MPTLKDVARLAGVSSASVSRILNKDLTLSVPPATREKVFEAAASLGYVKKQRKNDHQTMHIGIVQWLSAMEESKDPYYQSIRQGVENYCAQHKISITRCFASDSRAKKSLEKLDGIVCIGKFSSARRAELSALCPSLLFLDMKLDPITDCSIVPDFKGAMHLVFDHFSQLKLKRIGFLGGMEQLEERTYPDERLKYFRRFAAKEGYEYLPYLRTGSFSRESGYEMMRSLIEAGTIPQAIFAGSDPIAIGALKACHEAGLQVPEQISICGFDNIEEANYTFPPLTTVFVPTFEMGTLGMRLLHEAWQRSETLAPMRILLPCELILRETTGIQEHSHETETSRR